MSWVSRIKEKARVLKIELHAMWFAVRHPDTPVGSESDPHQRTVLRR